MPNTPAHQVLTSSTFDHLFQNSTYHIPLGVRVRKLLASLPVEQPSVMPMWEYTYPPYSMHTPTLCSSIFTDGSKNADGVGYSAILPKSNLSGRLPAAASIFTAELRAILSPLAYILRLPDDEFTVFSDSKSALQSICTPSASTQW